MELKQFNEVYSGWGSCDREGRPVGFEGYTLQDAECKKKAVKAFMQECRGIKEIKVYIKPIGNGKYQVINESTYES